MIFLKFKFSIKKYDYGNIFRLATIVKYLATELFKMHAPLKYVVGNLSKHSQTA